MAKLTKLTKRQALLDCITIWQYLADNPEANPVLLDCSTFNTVWSIKPDDAKHDAILAVLPDKQYMHDCPCCEYAEQHLTSCRKLGNSCIIPNWSDEAYHKGGNVCCTVDASPYHQWRHSKSVETSVKAAKAIIKLAKQALAKLEAL